MVRITLTRGELTERLQLRLSKAEVAKLRRISRETGVTISSIVRVGIDLAADELRANPPVPPDDEAAPVRRNAKRKKARRSR